MAVFIRVESIELLKAHCMRVRFTNGEQREIDLTPYIAEGPIFEPVRSNTAFFHAARVEGGTIVWPNGADIDPDVLYYNGPPPWASGELHISSATTDSR